MRTINRQPYSVKQLDYDDIDYKFFNHSEWKGIAESSNYIAVDQETFADAQNMYIDKEGMLHSRPSIKPCDIANNFTDKGKIIDVKIFNNIIVIVCDLDNIKTAYFCKYNNGLLEYDKFVQISSIKYFVTFSNQKVYIFTEDGLISYNTVNDELIDNAIEDIYVPNVKAYFNTVKTDRTLESENELTTGKTINYEYQYSGDSELSIQDYYNHYWLNGNYNNNNTIVKINNEIFSENLNEYSYLTFADKTYNIKVAKNAIGTGVENINNVVVVTCGDVVNGYYARYSLDYGVTWKVTPKVPLDGLTYYNTLFYLSDDTHLIYFIGITKHNYGTGISASWLYSIYAYSIIPDTDGILTFETWTDLLYDYKNTKGNDLSKASFFEDDDKATYAVPYCKVKSIGDFTIYQLSQSDLSYTELGITFYRYTNENEQPIEYKNSAIYNFNMTRKYIKDSIAVTFNYTKDFVRTIYCFYKGTFSDESISSNKIYLLGSIGVNGSELNLLHDVIIYKNIYASYNYNSIYSKHNIYLDTTDATYKILYLAKDSISYYDGEIHIITSVDDTSVGPYYIKGTPDKFITKQNIYYDNTVIELSSDIPISSDILMYIKKDEFYTQAAVKSISIQDVYIGNYNWLNFENNSELSSIFLSSGKNLYITATGAYSEDFQWYLPKLNTHNFDYDIQKLHPISDTVLAIFFENSVQYVAYDSENSVYLYNKSRIPVGICKDSDVITTFDNKYTIFPTKRGLAAMSYQDFISSTEQSLNFLTDVIFSRFDKWHNNKEVKLFQYKYWIICYKPDSYISYVLDLRNTSWWCESYKQYVDNIYEINYVPYLFVDGTFKKFNESSIDYYDGPSEKSMLINWYFRSQKLHFSAINYYKHIVSMTLSCVSDIDLNPFDNVSSSTKTEYGETKEFVLKVINYRKLPQVGGNTAQQNRGDTTAQMEVAMIRIFTKRLNYYKVNEFQYSMSSMTGSKTFKPMCLNNISIKYLITGQVR